MTDILNKNNKTFLFVVKLVTMGFTAIAKKPVANVYIPHAIKLMGIVHWVVKPAIGENYVTKVIYTLSNILQRLSKTGDVWLVCEIIIET